MHEWYVYKHLFVPFPSPIFQDRLSTVSTATKQEFAEEDGPIEPVGSVSRNKWIQLPQKELDISI